MAVSELGASVCRNHKAIRTTPYITWILFFFPGEANVGFALESPPSRLDVVVEWIGHLRLDRVYPSKLLFQAEEQRRVFRINDNGK